MSLNWPLKPYMLKQYVWLEFGENQIGMRNSPKASKIILSTQTS